MCVHPWGRDISSIWEGSASEPHPPVFTSPLPSTSFHPSPVGKKQTGRPLPSPLPPTLHLFPPATRHLENTQTGRTRTVKHAHTRTRTRGALAHADVVLAHARPVVAIACGGHERHRGPVAVWGGVRCTSHRAGVGPRAAPATLFPHCPPTAPPAAAHQGTPCSLAAAAVWARAPAPGGGWKGVKGVKRCGARERVAGGGWRWGARRARAQPRPSLSRLPTSPAACQGPSPVDVSMPLPLTPRPLTCPASQTPARP
jgi:hypothetical protein